MDVEAACSAAITEAEAGNYCLCIKTSGVGMLVKVGNTIYVPREPAVYSRW